MSSVARRLLAGFGANTFGRGTAMLIQIASVPVYLSHWGTSLYGEWLLLNAIPSYFLMSDIGFGTVAGNEMTMLVAAGRQEDALNVFQSVWALITSISSLCICCLLSVIWYLPIDRWFHLRAMPLGQARQVVVLLSLSILFGMQEVLFQAAFRCVGKYAYGTIAKNIVMLASFGAIMVAVILKQSAPMAAFVFMLVNWTGTVAMWILLKRKIPWIRFGIARASIATIRRLMWPAFSFMSFPLGNALSLQGTLIVIGHFLGPIAVVTFSTARTISRSVYQAMQLINNAVWPEMSAAFGKGDLALARVLHRRSCQLSFFLCISTIGLVAVFGDTIWSKWTIGKLSTDPLLLQILLFQMLVASLWFTSSVVPASINKHQGIAKLILSTTIISLVLSGLSVAKSKVGLHGVAVSLVIGDAIMAIYVLRESLILLHDSFGEFSAAMLRIPRLRKL
jgi:O-antigen/teichoic acid export membrane protein